MQPMPSAACRKLLHLAMVLWWCRIVSYDCKLDLVTVQSNIDGPRYQRDILETVVFQFDSHALVTRPVVMDDNPRPHRTRRAIHFIQRNVITTIP